MKKANTMDLKGNPYAKVPERVKIFREECPKGKIETDHSYLEDGMVEFRAWIWKDKTDVIDILKSGISDKDVIRNSADSNGTAKKVTKGEKDFEKLETIAIGRALATLGYLASGEIASSEEMEEFIEYQEEKKAEAIMEVTEQIGNCQTLEELKTLWASLSGEMKVLVKSSQEAKKLELQNENN
jgi:hypothetical protein